MNSESRPPLDGIFHVALNVKDVARARAFFCDVLGFRVEWQPDPDNCYLTSGKDNLALHKAPVGADLAGPGKLDHVGLIVPRDRDVDAWASFLASRGVAIEKPPRTHRDGARSCYARDPEGTLLQVIYHPPI
ncbi:VOC family protein, partial [bacterium]|nr:VOC family protein [bacterium]